MYAKCFWEIEFGNFPEILFVPIFRWRNHIFDTLEATQIQNGLDILTLQKRDRSSELSIKEIVISFERMVIISFGLGCCHSIQVQCKVKKGAQKLMMWNVSIFAVCTSWTIRVSNYIERISKDIERSSPLHAHETHQYRLNRHLSYGWQHAIAISFYCHSILFISLPHSFIYSIPSVSLLDRLKPLAMAWSLHKTDKQSLSRNSLLSKNPIIISCWYCGMWLRICVWVCVYEWERVCGNQCIYWYHGIYFVTCMYGCYFFISRGLYQSK